MVQKFWPQVSSPFSLKLYYYAVSLDERTVGQVGPKIYTQYESQNQTCLIWKFKMPVFKMLSLKALEVGAKILDSILDRQDTF